ncbi:MAG: hypothetical protein QXS14_05615 [Desulfurococcaceae archaeon]
MHKIYSIVRTAEKRAKKFNTLLTLANIVMACFLALWLFNNFIDKKQDVVILKQSNQEGERQYLLVYVIEDRIFNNTLKGKWVIIEAVQPLYLTVLDDRVRIAKQGAYSVQYYNSSVMLVNAIAPSETLRGKLKH